MTTYLDYYKTILNKVSFDAYLFHKEYRKAMRDLNTQEMSDLNKSNQLDFIIFGRENEWAID